MLEYQCRSVRATLDAAALLAVVVQITLGGWVSSNYAALACPLPLAVAHNLEAAALLSGVLVINISSSGSRLTPPSTDARLKRFHKADSA